MARPGATVWVISARWMFTASVLLAGRIKTAPLPCFGQTAPKMQVEVVRRAQDVLLRMPRFVHRRVISLF